MTQNYDVIIVGSGPAGVSAAFPLVQSGLRVLMLDGGHEEKIRAPEIDYLSARISDANQHKWIVGDDFYALRQLETISPKLRAPTLAYVFDGFSGANKIIADNFVAVGSLATGGMSNAWGCGVAKLSDDELAPFPFDASEIEPSYQAIAERIGISGRCDDDMSFYFGLDAWSQSPIRMDALHSKLLDGYTRHRGKIVGSGFQMGRSRVAVLNENRAGRKACDLSGNCLWGCSKKALYSASEDVQELSKYNNFRLEQGFTVQKIKRSGGDWSVVGKDNLAASELRSIRAKKIFLAAGTLATTRFVLQALNSAREVRLLSCPTAAFMLWLPSHFGREAMSSFGLGQLSFAMKVQNNIGAFGSTFSTSGIPVSEFVRHLPFHKRYGVDLMRGMLSSCLIGNVFLSGEFSTAKASLRSDGVLSITGGFDERVPAVMVDLAKLLRKAYRKMGAIVLPKSFTIGKPGGDIHYAGTLPMRSHPEVGETGPFGEVMGLDGIHVIDGACLATLSEKSHTFTIMANADRIGRAIATKSFLKSYQ
ncbi:GMC oxidoreductase [Mariprofundus ferrooxydans]|uniref:GMC oxidoreductase n=1 Tax=Mariprofundus ferrooxydans TaxID=314344 RepID=UPI001430E69A|nr:GMC oxidoreductase [Mariprofundus ferrooxydans]